MASVLEAKAQRRRVRVNEGQRNGRARAACWTSYKYLLSLNCHERISDRPQTVNECPPLAQIKELMLQRRAVGSPGSKHIESFVFGNFSELRDHFVYQVTQNGEECLDYVT